MSATPDFLDTNRPDVPDIVVPRGVTPFHLPGHPVRGRLVRLGPLADALLRRHGNPLPVTGLAGQALALAAGLSSALKYRGSFSLQAKGDGPLSMLLADCTQEGALRFYARFDEERLSALLTETPAPAASDLLGSGYLAFTVDQGSDTDRYQGIVSIEGESLAEMALHYFRTSEQVEYDVHLACAQRLDGWRASALILERVAGEGSIDPALDHEAQTESWHTARTLAATITENELLDDALTADTLIWRLFGTEGVAVDRPRALAYGCRCSRAKLSGILESFPAEDLDEMAANGAIVMTCEFCKWDFSFLREDIRSREARGLTGWRMGAAALCLALPMGLSACGGDEAPPTEAYTQLHYEYLPKLRLNVGAVTVEDRAHPIGPDDIAGQSPAIPALALEQMAHDRLFAASTAGAANFVVDQASIVRQPNGTLSGVLAVHLDITAPSGANAGYATARSPARAYPRLRPGKPAEQPLRSDQADDGRHECGVRISAAQNALELAGHRHVGASTCHRPAARPGAAASRAAAACRNAAPRCLSGPDGTTAATANVARAWILAGAERCCARAVLLRSFRGRFCSFLKKRTRKLLMLALAPRSKPWPDGLRQA